MTGRLRCAKAELSAIQPKDDVPKTVLAKYSAERQPRPVVGVSAAMRVTEPAVAHYKKRLSNVAMNTWKRT